MNFFRLLSRISNTIVGVPIVLVLILCMVILKIIVIPTISKLSGFLYQKDMRMLRDPTTHPDVLRKIVESYTCTKPQDCFKNPKKIATLLKAWDTETWWAIARNPNTPVDILWCLLRNNAADILENPVFPLIVLENPAWIREIPAERLIDLFENQALIPDLFIKEAVSKGSIEVGRSAILSVARNILYGGDYLEEVTLLHGYLYLPVLCHSSLEPKSLEKFASQGSKAIQLELAQYCYTGMPDFGREQLGRVLYRYSIIPKILRSRSQLFKFYALQQPDFPSSDIDYVLQELSHDLLMIIAKDTTCSKDVLESLEKHVMPNQNLSIQIHQRLARNPKTPTDTLNRLARSRYSAVRANVALHSHLPIAIVSKLARDPHKTVTKRLRQNSQISPNLIAALTKQPNPKIQRFIKQYPNTPKII